MLTAILAFIPVIAVLIFFQELGHFLVARSFGMGVTTFSLGFGPKLLKWKPHKTEYALSLVPLGGYVALVGETDDEIPEGFTEEECFSKRPAWQRFLVCLAGPVANFLLAWILCYILAFFYGTPYLAPEVGSVKEGSPAASAGLVAGDMIVSVDGKKVSSWEDMAAIISESEGRPMRFAVERNDRGALEIRIFEIAAKRATVTTFFNEEKSTWIVGIAASGRREVRKESFFSAPGAGFKQTWRMMEITWQGFVKLVQGVVPADQVGGPIMIAQLVGQQVEHGFEGLLFLTALISVNLGILNLLPIPVLDGGTLVFCSIEMIFRRPLNEKFQEYALRFGLGLLVALMIFATYNDIKRLFTS